MGLYAGSNNALHRTPVLRPVAGELRVGQKRGRVGRGHLSALPTLPPRGKFQHLRPTPQPIPNLAHPARFQWPRLHTNARRKSCALAVTPFALSLACHLLLALSDHAA